MPQAARVTDPYSDGDFQAQGAQTVFVNNLPFARLTDATTGHGCWPPAIIDTASQNVFANFLQVAKVGDHHIIHCCPDDGCHDGNFVSGSPNVYVNDAISGAQPTVSFPDAVMMLQDEEPEPVPLPATSQRQVNKNAAYKQAFGSDFTFQNNPPATLLDGSQTKPKPTPSLPTPSTVPQDCGEIFSHVGPFPGTFKLSTHFTLAMLTTNTIVSNYPLIAQGGLSEAQIVCNLRKLCVNVLEPLLQTYGDLVINSGFRHLGNGATNSQHFKGQAADITFANLVSIDDFNSRAFAIKKTGLYDQMIYEQNRPQKSSTWYHLSYADAKRGQVLTKKAFSDTYFPGLYNLTFSS